MVMDLLGPSLWDRFWRCSNRFSLRTTAALGLGMLDAIEYIHSQGFINRDIKPENFLLGRGTTSQVVHIVDFGLARRWRHAMTGAHISSPNLEGAIGTLRFASIHAHLGQAQTRRDDLHALAYTILLFARGNLPWEIVRQGTQKHRERRVLEKKRSWSAARLCQDLPKELEAFASHCFGLAINEEPDYRLLRDKLAAIATREGWNASAKFEWEEPGWTAATSTVPDPAVPSPKQLPPLCIKRGDVMLLKLNLEKTLDCEYVPRFRLLDTSFFPHRAPIGVGQPPFRPAVVRRVISDKDDDMYFTLEVYGLTHRAGGLDGLSARRRHHFLPLEGLNETATGIQAPCDDLFLYTNTFLGKFRIEYDQAATITSQLFVPESIFTPLEDNLSKLPSPHRLLYESDDEETRTIQKRRPRAWYVNQYVMEMRPCTLADLSGCAAADIGGITGWCSEMLSVEEVRRRENGESSDDDDSDDDMEFWDWPRVQNRRLSCTLGASVVADVLGKDGVEDLFSSSSEDLSGSSTSPLSSSGDHYGFP